MEPTEGQLRFVKKLPPSGISKLTLPHQLVEQRLQHLLEGAFELASSSSAQTAWSGSIAIRRNKNRNEYVLQGWKLFAEAHGFQAGDHIYFELISTRRVVARCIQPTLSTVPSSSASLVRRTPATPDSTLQLRSKIRKSSGHASPASSQGIQQPGSARIHDRSSDQKAAQQPTLPLMESVAAPMNPANQGQDAAAVLTRESDGQPVFWNDNQAERAQGLVPTKVSSRHTAQRVPVHAMLDLNMDNHAPTDLGVRCSEASEKAPVSPLSYDLPSIFDDVHEDLHGLLSGLPLAEENTVGANSSPSSNLSSVNRFQLAPVMPQAQQQEHELRALVSKTHEQLDHSTRAALKAAMGIESCAVEMSSSAPGGMQANLFKRLSELKSSLWELLLISAPESASP